jgi:DNA-binding MarR family transcriptional regulator
MTTHANQEEITEEIRILKRLEELLTLLAKTALSERLAEIYDDKQHRLLFEKVGQMPVTDLAKKTGLSAGTISGLWQRWEQAGLLIKEGKQYRRVL